jgi:chemotaxis protein histidine kinase CheA
MSFVTNMNNSDFRPRSDGVVPAGLRDMFHRAALERVRLIESAAVSLRLNALDMETRALAERAAHKVAAAAKMFGYWDARELASEAQAAFDGTDPIPPNIVIRLLEIATELRRQFS